MSAETPEKCTALLTKALPELESLIALIAKPGINVNAVAKQELEYLRMHMVVKPFISNCVPETVVMAVKYCLKNNLSLDPNANLVYLMPQNVKINKEWKTVLEITPTAEGRLSINYQCKTILDHKRPVIKKHPTTGKVTAVEVEFMFPGHTVPRWEAIEFDESDFERWRAASHKKNSRGKEAHEIDNTKLNWANALYTSFNGGIDPEFARSKCISHGLKKRGVNMNAVMMPPISEPTPSEPGKVTFSKEAATVEVNAEKKEEPKHQFDEAQIISETTNNKTEAPAPAAEQPAPPVVEKQTPAPAPVEDIYLPNADEL